VKKKSEPKSVGGGGKVSKAFSKQYINEKINHSPEKTPREKRGGCETAKIREGKPVGRRTVPWQGRNF